MLPAAFIQKAVPCRVEIQDRFKMANTGPGKGVSCKELPLLSWKPRVKLARQEPEQHCSNCCKTKHSLPRASSQRCSCAIWAVPPSQTPAPSFLSQNLVSKQRVFHLRLESEFELPAEVEPTALPPSSHVHVRQSGQTPEQQVVCRPWVVPTVAFSWSV